MRPARQRPRNVRFSIPATVWRLCGGAPGKGTGLIARRAAARHGLRALESVQKAHGSRSLKKIATEVRFERFDFASMWKEWISALMAMRRSPGVCSAG